MAEADRYYIDRLIKTVLWMKGGFKIYISGDDGICEQMKHGCSYLIGYPVLKNLSSSLAKFLLVFVNFALFFWLSS